MDIISELLENSGAKPYNWGDDIGETVSGPIENIRRKQSIDFQSKRPETWDDGTPKMVHIVTVQTDLAEDDDDDGLRDIWLRGHAHIAFLKAVKKARITSESELEGMLLTITLSERGKKEKGKTPAKLFTVELTSTSV